MKPYRPALIVVALLALGACKGEKKTADQRTAAGQVLPGSTSDAMLPYDTLRSQPPLAPPTGSGGSGKTKGDKAESGPTAEASSSDSPAPEPLAAPTGEAVAPE